MQSVPQLYREKGIGTDLPLLTQVRLFFRRHLDIETRRKVKHLLRLDRVWQPQEVKHRDPIEQDTPLSSPLDLQAGELVKVRSREEILATLDSQGKLKGCSFIDVMWPYCGTTQRVLKPVRRFVDERNYQVRNTRGLVLLEGVMCTGTGFYGNCDRSCLFFWREEWLERVDG
jgi:hypothetical protein